MDTDTSSPKNGDCCVELEYKGSILTRPGKSKPEQVNGKSSPSDSGQVKQCSKCCKVKPLASFYFNQKKLKADSQCVDCKKAGVKARRKSEADAMERIVPKPLSALEYDSHEGRTSGLLENELAEVLRVFEKLRQWRDEYK